MNQKAQREGFGRGENMIFIFSLFVSFSNLQKLDHRFSSGLKAKLIYATRATCGH